MPPELARIVDELDLDGHIEARFVLEPPRVAPRLGLLPGSFNPPTNAHLGLAHSGRAAGLSSVVYVLSKRTVNKETVDGIPLADRLQLLIEIARSDANAVAFANRGLYVDLAEGMRALRPEASLSFLVGFDKIVQIFDPRYYDDRDLALDRLFDLASFLVAPRGASSESDLERLLSQPENRRFRDRVTSLPLPPELREQSSTRIRLGESGEVPSVVEEYLRRHHPYSRSG